jgi:TIR domain
MSRQSKALAKISSPPRTGVAMIFVSYSRHDQAVCDEVVRALEERGHRVWLDRKAIRGGDVWRADIEDGIKNADVFIILLSPNLSDYTRSELEFAEKSRKKIIALRLKPQKELPPGYELVLSGRQHIEMADFNAGIERLLEALGNQGPKEPAQPAGLWTQALRKAQRVRAVVANSEMGPKALKLGAAALAGAAAVVATVATINEEKRRAALNKYRGAVEKILLRCNEELALTAGMTADDYIREFRPRVQRLLGQLEATAPPTEELNQRHQRLLANLQRTVDEYDHAVTKIEHGDVGAFRRAVSRVVAAFSETLHAYKVLLDGMT